PRRWPNRALWRAGRAWQPLAAGLSRWRGPNLAGAWRAWLRAIARCQHRRPAAAAPAGGRIHRQTRHRRARPWRPARIRQETRDKRQETRDRSCYVSCLLSPTSALLGLSLDADL